MGTLVDTTECACNAGFVGNGITACKPCPVCNSTQTLSISACDSKMALYNPNNVQCVNIIIIK